MASEYIEERWLREPGEEWGPDIKTWICGTCGAFYYARGEWPNHCFEKPGTQLSFYDADRIIKEENES